MSITVRFNPTANSEQAVVIPNATRRNDGVMTKEQVALLGSGGTSVVPAAEVPPAADNAGRIIFVPDFGSGPTGTGTGVFLGSDGNVWFMVNTEKIAQYSLTSLAFENSTSLNNGNRTVGVQFMPLYAGLIRKIPLWWQTDGNPYTLAVKVWEQGGAELASVDVDVQDELFYEVDMGGVSVESFQNYTISMYEKTGTKYTTVPSPFVAGANPVTPFVAGSLMWRSLGLHAAGNARPTISDAPTVIPIEPWIAFYSF